MAVQENDAMQKEKEALLKELLGPKKDESGTLTTEAAPGENSFAEAEPKGVASGIPTLDSEEKIEENLDISEPVVMKVSKPMPKYGQGGIFIPITIGVTILGIVLGHIKPITRGIPSAAWVRYLYIAFGVVILFFGIKLIVDSNAVSAISENVRLGKIVTTGAYSKTRNPQYTGLIFICTALLFFSGNAFMYILPIGFYIFLTKLMQNTEEVILSLRFKEEYEEYKKRTNRIIPIKKR